MLILETKIERLPVFVYGDRTAMGKSAAAEAAVQIRELIRQKGEANIVFAAAPSQSDFFAALLEEDIDWSRVRGFHQDEYVGLDPACPAQFGNFLRRHIADRVGFRSFAYMECRAGEEEAGCAAYAALLRAYPPDIICLGVGENGHLAFNDPPVADFDDPLAVKVVELDAVCRNQQVHDGCFDHISEVPTHAVTLTLSCIMRIPSAIAIVPTAGKADAVHGALRGPVTTECPASVLRRHPNARLYLERSSAGKAFDLEKEARNAVV